jgi:UDP-glucuronate 4-epimerase
VAELLLVEGHGVIGVDNLNDEYDVRLKRWRLDRLCGRAGFSFSNADVRNREALAAVSSVDAVIHLAARVGVRKSLSDPWAYVDTNVNGTLNLLEFCRREGIPKFVLASSSSVYGGSKGAPSREDGETCRPASPYAASKKSAELLAYSYHHLYGLDVTVLRYFTVYGPAGRPDMSVFRFIRWLSEERPIQIFGDGGQRRDFTHVDDIAYGTIAALRPVGFEIINLGSNSPLALLDVIDRLGELMGTKPELRFCERHSADVEETWADVGRARTILAWRPAIPCARGLETAVAWYGDNLSWARNISID